MLSPARALACSLLGALALAACGNSTGLPTSSTASGATTNGSSTGTTSGSATATGSGGGTQGTTAGSSTSGFSTAPHQPLPEIPPQGGPVLSPLDIVTIRYADSQLDLGGYTDVLLASNWFNQVGAEYQITGGQHVADYVIDGGGPSALQDSDVQNVIIGLMDAGVIPEPQSPGNMLYAIEIPQETTVTLMGATSCSQFGGYHGFADGGFPYAVIDDCPLNSESGFTDPAGYDEFTASHEYFEAASDPLPDTRPQYTFSFASPVSYPWLACSLSELADLCSFAPPVEIDAGIYATRIWSNAAADAGLSDPCVPTTAGEIYYNVSVVLDGGSFPGDPGNLAIASASLSTPQVFSFDITGWSTAPAADWYLFPDLIGGNFTPTVALSNTNSMGFTTLGNGGTETLTVTVPANTPSGSEAGIVLFSGTALPYANVMAVGVVVE